jgi:hypothetical protein
VSRFGTSDRRLRLRRELRRRLPLRRLLRRRLFRRGLRERRRLFARTFRPCQYLRREPRLREFRRVLRRELRLRELRRGLRELRRELRFTPARVVLLDRRLPTRRFAFLVCSRPWLEGTG